MEFSLALPMEFIIALRRFNASMSDMVVFQIGFILMFAVYPMGGIFLTIIG